MGDWPFDADQTMNRRLYLNQIEDNMPDDMLEANAIGGPRDGIKLAAPVTWDGRVYRNNVAYPGHYEWVETGINRFVIGAPAILTGSIVIGHWQWIETGDTPRRPRSKRSDLELEL